jgi:signal transduction histidine kinase
VEQITEAASEITVAELSRRISVPDTGDAFERLARTFNSMLGRLQVAVEKIEQFSADASHELRTPLSVIRTTAELGLRHERSKDEYQADLKDIHVESERLGELVETLLALSREGVTGGSILMKEIDLVALVEEVTSRFEKAARSKGLVFEVEIVSEGIHVMGNESALRRMMSSIMENALAHTEKGTITVRLDDPTDEIQLSIADTGVGIPEGDLDRIFDRFYRVDASRSRSSGGLGLGLAIAKKIADLHGAVISVSSQLGEGSKFAVRFNRTTDGTRRQRDDVVGGPSAV